jgi:hypothetical protein
MNNAYLVFRCVHFFRTESSKCKFQQCLKGAGAGPTLLATSRQGICDFTLRNLAVATIFARTSKSGFWADTRCFSIVITI